MNILQPSFEIWLQEPGLQGIYRQVERAGRVCYKSENHLTADSAEPFVRRMIQSSHTAMLEHATVYLQGDEDGPLKKYMGNRFTHCRCHNGQIYVSTNLRVLVENGWMDDLKLIGEPTPEHERRVTVHFTTQVAITREFNRHRANSMAEQSTRYCNYSKDKFGGEMSVNEPAWVREASAGGIEAGEHKLADLCRDIADGRGSADWTDIDCWLFANLASELAYMTLVSHGRKPQEARVVLPLDVNTELVHTAFVSDWKHFFNLRALGTTGAPHPDAKVLAMPLYMEFQQRGLL